MVRIIGRQDDRLTVHQTIQLPPDLLVSRLTIAMFSTAQLELCKKWLPRIPPRPIDPVIQIRARILEVVIFLARPDSISIAIGGEISGFTKQFGDGANRIWQLVLQDTP